MFSLGGGGGRGFFYIIILHHFHYFEWRNVFSLWRICFIYINLDNYEQCVILDKYFYVYMMLIYSYPMCILCFMSFTSDNFAAVSTYQEILRKL